MQRKCELGRTGRHFIEAEKRTGRQVARRGRIRDQEDRLWRTRQVAESSRAVQNGANWLRIIRSAVSDPLAQQSHKGSQVFEGGQDQLGARWNSPL